ncbi:MAG: hypothetical protein FJ221_18520 [Lentisphaerae bacterium]|nr:hypothetical protein [Lentisphaerota bacterium]
MNGGPPRAGRRWPLLIAGILLVAPSLIPFAVWGPAMTAEFFTESLPEDLVGGSSAHILLLAWILILPATGIALLIAGCRRRRTALDGLDTTPPAA